MDKTRDEVAVRPLEVAISIDTTVSMYHCLEEVREDVQDLVHRLYSDIEGCSISVITHGDYCSGKVSYVIKWLDFGATEEEICDFIRTVPKTLGGDPEECYELVMKHAREFLSWTPGSVRIFIMIGDDLPHEPGYTHEGKSYTIDWREECVRLRRMNVKMYAVQAGINKLATKFFQEISRETDGKYVNLSEFSSISDDIITLFNRESMLEIPILEQEIQDRPTSPMSMGTEAAISNDREDIEFFSNLEHHMRVTEDPETCSGALVDTIDTEYTSQIPQEDFHAESLEVAISIDTTASMYYCLEETRKNVQDLVHRLLSDILGCRISVIAHGDYFSEKVSYVIKWLDFGATEEEICDFISTVPKTLGGDPEECYELVMKHAREFLSWTPGSVRIFIIIGDDLPHEPGSTYKGKTYTIDWREECVRLRRMGVKIYGVQAGSNKRSANFFSEISTATFGKHFNLTEFSSIFDVIKVLWSMRRNPETPVHNAARPEQSLSAEEVLGISHDTKQVIAKGTEQPSPILKSNKMGETHEKDLVKLKTIKTVKKRDQLPDSCMRQGVFRCLTWSRWKEVLTFKLPADKKKNLFQKCRTQNGYTLKNWFDKSFHTPAIYEVAVQNSKEVLKRHKCVVYYRICIAGFTSRCNWSAFLFRDKTTRNKVNRALGQNCTVLVRRGDVSGLNDAAERAKMLEISKYVRDNFDYAWRNQRKTDGR